MYRAWIPRRPRAGVLDATTSRARALTRATLLALLVPFAAARADQAVLSAEDIFHPVHARHGMVAAQEARAARVGVEILRKGGNAVDAAVAVGFTLAVTLPRAGNLGGGGFMLVHLVDSGETVAIDYRETAPAAAQRDMYLDADGNVDKHKARFSHSSAGVPGTVAGLALALERYGRSPLPATGSR
jgi:gamma-glutamyltranspeptidase/glutathione hydrolase